MRIHDTHLWLVGWPADKLPSVSARLSLLDTIVGRTNKLLERTNRRLQVSASLNVMGLQPQGWRPILTGDVDPASAYPLVVVLEYDPAYVGGGWFAYTGGDGTPQFGCAIMRTHSIDLEEMNDRDRDQLLHTPEHEFKHLFGCAIGEMYDFRRAKDVTGTLPKLDLDAWDEKDAFWSAHKEWLRDPMVSNDGDRLCDVNEWIVNGNFSGNHAPKMPASIKIVVDVEDTAGVEIELWRHAPERGESRQELMFRTPTRLPGALVAQGIHASLIFPGETIDTLSSFDLYLLKVRGNTDRGGKIEFASWVSLWDFVECKEAVVQISFTSATPATPPTPSDENLSRPVFDLTEPGCGIGADGKPVFRFAAVGLAAGELYVLEQTPGAGQEWSATMEFFAAAYRMEFELPHRVSQRFYRLRRVGAIKQ